MLNKLIVTLLKLMARMVGSDFHQDFHMRNALNSIYEEGVMARGSGFVFEDGEKTIGIYVVTYESAVRDNINGRWN
jgi:hypothetical protein